jgi:hypothetical protein
LFSQQDKNALAQVILGGCGDVVFSGTDDVPMELILKSSGGIFRQDYATINT